MDYSFFKIIKQIIKNTGIIIVGHCILGLMNVATVILLARYFGHSGFGKISFLNGFFLLFTTAQNLWIKPILVKRLSAHNTDASHLLGNSIIIYVLLSAITIILFWLTIFIVNCPADMILLAGFTSFNMLLLSIISAYVLIFQVRLKMKYYIYINVCSHLLSITLLLLIVSFGGTLLHYYIASIIPSIVSILLVKHYAGRIVNPTFTIDLSLWKKIFHQSWPLSLTVIFIFIYSRIDQIMLIHMKGVNAVGTYSVAVKLVDIFYIIPVALIISVFPLLSKYFAENKIEIFSQLYNLSFKYLLIIIFPLATIITFLSKDLIVLLYGNSFTLSSPALRILIWSEVFIFMGVVNNSILIAANKQIFDPLFTGLSALVNVLLNLLLIPKFDVNGAAIATVIACATGPVVGYFLKETKAYSLSMFYYSAKPLCASLIMGTIMYFYFFQNFWLILFIAPCIYAAVLFLIKGVDRYDIRIIKTLIFEKKLAA
ncbi:MAG: flippase [Candidatus Omnitrophica bacterium]|nr:flippase [Candidatus Omnitrophota bacterium]